MLDLLGNVPYRQGTVVVRDLLDVVLYCRVP
jgi:hypothetical protein